MNRRITTTIVKWQITIFSCVCTQVFPLKLQMCWYTTISVFSSLCVTHSKSIVPRTQRKVTFVEWGRKLFIYTGMIQIEIVHMYYVAIWQSQQFSNFFILLRKKAVHVSFLSFNVLFCSLWPFTLLIRVSVFVYLLLDLLFQSMFLLAIKWQTIKEIFPPWFDALLYLVFGCYVFCSLIRMLFFGMEIVFRNEIPSQSATTVCVYEQNDKCDDYKKKFMMQL